MTTPGTIAGMGLPDRAIGLIVGVLARHSELRRAIVFGSRARGSARPNSDIDLALDFAPDTADRFTLTNRIAGELDDLPLPYTFDVQALDRVRSPTLRDHIEQAGVTLYAATHTTNQPGPGQDHAQATPAELVPGVDRAPNP